MTFNSAPLAGTNVTPLSLTNQTGMTGFVGETDKGGPVDNKGFTITPTLNSAPVVTAPATFTIPLRTPFALTGSATDADGDTLTYLWEQNDRGGVSGTALTNNTKVDGPLFRQFSLRANVTPADSLLYHSPGENAVTTNPTRVFPDLPQILANNTNADTGTCANVDCFSEFLPTASYAGVAGVNASPLSLHFRLTVRDGNTGGGGVNSADTTLLLATGAGPFLVSAPNTAVTWTGNTSQNVTWAVANTSAPPVSATNVKISLSVDAGLTYPHVLAASTPNDGTQAITVPNVNTTQARVKVEAVGNVFFDVSNANFTIQSGIPAPVVTNNAPGGGALAPYGGPVAPTVTVSATDADSLGTALNASAPGLPAGPHPPRGDDHHRSSGGADVDGHGQRHRPSRDLPRDGHGDGRSGGHRNDVVQHRCEQGPHDHVDRVVGQPVERGPGRDVHRHRHDFHSRRGRSYGSGHLPRRAHDPGHSHAERIRSGRAHDHRPRRGQPLDHGGVLG